MVALMLMGIISVVFLGALAISSNGRFIADKQASAKILAESQMEHVKKQVYATSYEASFKFLKRLLNVFNLEKDDRKNILAKM